MATSSTSLCSKRVGRLATPGASRPHFLVRQVSGRTEPFRENVAQVKRLINRDRKEFLGNDEDILDKYKAEFGADAAASPSSSTANPFTSPGPSPATPAASAPSSSSSSSSAAATLSSDNPFKSSSASSIASPFGSKAAAPAKVPFKQSIEPKGLTPDMSPDPIVKETPFDLIKSIGRPQIIIFCTFSSMIGLMIGTFYVVLNAGGVRLAGLD